MRHTQCVAGYGDHVKDTEDSLEFIVNNACQTVRRPPEFYRHMLENETTSAHGMPAHVQRLLGAYEGLRRYDMLPAGVPALLASASEEIVGVARSAELSQVPLLPEDLPSQENLFPDGRLAQDPQHTAPGR